MRRRKRAYLAWIVSGALHLGLALVLLLLRRGSAPPAVHETPVTFEIVDMPAPVEAVPAIPAAPAPRRRETLFPRATERGVDTPSPAEVGAPPSPVVAPPVSATPSVAPPAGLDLLRLRVPETRSLLPDEGTIARLQADGIIGDPGPGVGRPAAKTESSWTRQTPRGLGRKDATAILNESAAADNIRTGRVHPLVYDYLRDARRRFEPSLALVEREAGAISKGSGVRLWISTWLDSLKSRPDPRLRDLPTAVSPDTIAIRNSGGQALECLICVSIFGGGPAQIEVARGSGSDVFDLGAREALTLGIAARPAEESLVPRHLRGKTGVKACYRFSSRALAIPPSLTPLACGVDSAGKFACVYPFKDVMENKIALVGVDYL